MAYSSSSNKLMFFFLAFLLLFLFSTNLVAGESDKVKLNLYYESLYLESLCDHTTVKKKKKIITDDLVKLFESDLHGITDLKLVPFGNAKVPDNLTVICQHGEEECKLNAIEACAVRTWPNPTYGGEKAIRDCYSGDISKNLILAYAKQTLNLKPKKKYVPWVTVNSMPLYDNYDDFVVQVCKAYKGRSPLPKFCSSASAKKKVLTLQVSYADEAFHY
ncbi:hypothetical protein Bca52824_058103 [Brassica carinata]|uniref:Uncharacterized protein n=1 Tax=Brassica carinata TaxID=52824 RepID=A0A8X7QTN2_BRACI|nr:hypothetical protein Bca52824_058103 [Brassica carinata]